MRLMPREYVKRKEIYNFINYINFQDIKYDD